MKTKEITYEVRFYETKTDFEKRNADLIESGFVKKSVAIKHAKMYVNSGEYEVAKIQSSDREFIKILTK